MAVNESECGRISTITLEQEQTDIVDLRLVFLLYAFPVLTGVIGNVGLLSLVACNSHVRTKPMLFLISIAAADLVLSIILGGYEINRYYRLLRPSKTMGALLCQVTSYAELTVQTVLVFSLLAVSVERFVVVCYPLQANRIWTKPRCRVIIVIVWASAMLVGLIEALTKVKQTSTCFHLIVTDDGNREVIEHICSRTGKRGVQLIIACIRLCILFAVPFLLMAVFYGAVIYRLWKSTDKEMPTRNVTGRRFTRNVSEAAFSITTSTKKQPSDARFFKRHMKQRNVSTGAFSNVSTSSIFSFASSLLSVITRSASSENVSAIDASSCSVFVTPALEYVARRQMAVEVKNSRKRVIGKDLILVMKMLLLVVTLFVICWGPKLILDVMKARMNESYEMNPSIIEDIDFDDFAPILENDMYDQYGNDTVLVDIPFSRDLTQMLDLATPYIMSLMLFHSTINPLIYIAFSSDFRAALCPRRRRVKMNKRNL